MKLILRKLANVVLIKKIIFLLKDNKKTVLSFILATIFVDILFFKEASDLMFFGVVIIYLVFTKMFLLKSRLTFLISLALLIMMFFNYLFTAITISTEKAAVWLVLFLVIGIIQQWREQAYLSK